MSGSLTWSSWHNFRRQFLIKDPSPYQVVGGYQPEHIKGVRRAIVIINCQHTEKQNTVKPLLSGLLLSGHLPQSNLSYSDSCYPGTSLNRAADSLYLSINLAEIVGSTEGVANYSLYIYEIQTNLSYGHPLIPRRPNKRGFDCTHTCSL